MLNQSIQVNSIILGAAQIVQEQQTIGQEAQPLVLASYDLLRAIGMPWNGLVMVYGSLVDELGDGPDKNVLEDPLKCQLCEEEASNMVQTSGGNKFIVCHTCASQLELHGAKVIL